MRRLGVVLAGGASRRMGENKLSLPISSECNTTILEHVVDCLSHVADDLFIAHAPTPSFSLERFNRYTRQRVHFVQDESWYYGPLGVLARLYTSLPKADTVYVTAGDLPGLHSNVLKACGARMDEFCTQEQEIQIGVNAVLVKRDNTLQPLLGCYRPHALSAFYDAWQAGETRLMPVLDKLKIEAVVSEEANWPAWWTKPVHTPEDYATWKMEWREYHAT